MTPFQVTNQAVEDVEVNNKVYCDKLCAFAENWVKTQMKPFTADDLKKAFFNSGNAPPSQPSVFGAPFRKLSKRHLIFDTERTIKSTNKEAHQRPLRVWISREYSQVQQANASQHNRNQISIFNQL
jgi:hypothetical protein